MAKKIDLNRKGNVKVAGAESICKDKNCPIHGTLSVRGRIFEGTVTKKFQKRVTISFERNAYVRKYERYIKYTTKIHAHLPLCMDKEINIGDYVRIRECRPLSKLIHFVVIKKIRDGEKNEKKVSVHSK